MAKQIKSVNLLPEFLKTDRNSKFLSSTIDQLIQPPQLERLNAYVGSTKTPTYNSTADIYISNGKPYQLDPALVTRDNLGNITAVQGYDDLINEISAKGGLVDNLDRLFRSNVYSYNPHIDWDKLVNYQNYYWLPDGPELLDITTNNLDVENEIIGQETVIAEILTLTGIQNVSLSNGMLIEFGGTGIDEEYKNKIFFVEGVGTSIKLIPFSRLLVSENFLDPYPDGYDTHKFDNLPFDNDRELPKLHAEYVTISRKSSDLNAWSRYNRWVHKDVIRQSAILNGLEPEYPVEARAQRPIIEFVADIKLFNYGTIGTQPIDIYDTHLDVLGSIIGSTSTVYVDGVALEAGHRVVFAASNTPNTIYEVDYINSGLTRTLTLNAAETPTTGTTIAVLLGDENNGTDWWFDGTSWQFAQQKTKLNQAPLFDLYDLNGNSYSNKDYYLSNFTGNKVFSYIEGTGDIDPYLGFPISYRNFEAIGGIEFSNDLVTDKIIISQLGKPTYTILTNVAYVKIGNDFKNAWVNAVDYEIPVLSSTATGITSYYEEPLSLTNNPLNGVIKSLTISELTEHVNSMVARIPGYVSGVTSLRDLADYTAYGIKLISSENPISFAQMFVGKKENSVVDAIGKSANKYNKFKLSFLNETANVANSLNPVEAVDEILTNLFEAYPPNGPYYYSDMAPFGTPDVLRTWTVTNPSTVSYPLTSAFDLSNLTLRSVLVYLNGEQLLYGKDYTFDYTNESIEILTTLAIDDVIEAKDFKDTTASYIPPTPTKLGLYPKFEPKIYSDNTYVTAQNVIQCHDGSIIVAYNDYRDNIILELEKRIYNNIKCSYRSDLLDINQVIPGAFRNTEYSLAEVNAILEGDFVKWATEFSIDYVANSTFDPAEYKTWNYSDTYQPSLGIIVQGSWRAVFKQLYDTDRPHTHPWEMLGFSVMPDWWETQYGAGPWTSADVLWTDIEGGFVNDPAGSYFKSNYERPGLINLLPVTGTGALRPINQILQDISDPGKLRPWKVGDHGPAESAWRRSSYYPFAVQRMLALTIPATYSALMYDPSRVQKNISGQWVYGDDETFLKFENLFLSGEQGNLTNGYSVFVAEIGKQRNNEYLDSLREDLNFATYNLFFKAGGFIDKDTLQVIIDSFEPTSNAPGAILPPQNYTLRLNVGNPIRSIGISGVIVQKLNNEYVVRGYDTQESYFTIYQPLRNLNTPTVKVGGKPEKYVRWETSGTAGGSGLTAADTTTANSAPSGKFYTQGQVVLYGNNYYRVKVSHQAGAAFNPNYFVILPGLPTTGGAEVQGVQVFDKKTTRIPYGSSYKNIQEVYDVLVGYGKWLESQGVQFDDFNEDLQEVMNWETSGKEFLYWTTQNWDNGAVITISPFAEKLVYKSNDSVVNNIFDSFYDYSILRADATPFPKEGISVSRENNVFVLSTLPNTDGVYFVRLNLVQKEHAMIFDNETIFGDTIYNVETGTRQRRVKLVGFRTANWNGDYSSPGFIYDTAVVKDWEKNRYYISGDTVRFNGNFYSAKKNISREDTFDFGKWQILKDKPMPGLLPNFDYKINQFEDFYSLDVDNFDENQQALSQHLTGYTPRVYLNNIFTDPVAQYKFYQGFIKDKGTKNAVEKLSKASLQTLKGEVSYNEEWALRLGNFGSFPSYQELETPLAEGTFVENPQILKFVDVQPAQSSKDLLSYITPDDLTIVPENYSSDNLFLTTSTEDILALVHAGYVRVDDVSATAYNENSLLDIANSDQLKDGDTIWLGFKQDGSWDVYRYSYNPAAIVGVYVSAPISTITFTTEYPHGLAIGNMIGVKQFNEQVNGIYVVQDIPTANQFTVASELAAIENAPLEEPGQLYVFETARLTDFDKFPSDKKLQRLDYGTKFWVDPARGNGWEVYEKKNNFSSEGYLNPSLPAAPALGQAISKRKGSNVVVVGAPRNYRGTTYGVVWLYDKLPSGELKDLVRYRIGTSAYGNTTGFGSVVVYDDIPFSTSTYGLIFVGAPVADNGKGVVKISSINSSILTEGISTFITNSTPGIAKFGSSIFVERNTSTKLVLIAAEKSVHSYTVKDTGSIVVTGGTILEETENTQTPFNIVGADNASTIAIGSFKTVKIYNKSLSKIQTITSKEPSFAKSLAMSPNGEYLFIGMPEYVGHDSSLGAVAIYKKVNGTYEYKDTLFNPVQGVGMKFGSVIDIDPLTNTLAISALGVNHTFPTIFDSGKTIFDGGITNILGSEANSGAVYVYYRQYERFVLGQEVTTDYVAQNFGTNYGASLAVDTNEIFVGMPSIDNLNARCGFYKFDKIDQELFSLAKIRAQDDFVEVRTIKKVAIVDTDKDTIVEYLDLIDPLKGKIAGIAEEELDYKLISDPAIYSIGINGVNVDTTKNWLDDHVGELWWDLSTAKYLWYEQSDLQYRKNNWGKLFPGATIDVYEWVRSTLLPTEWAAIADTPKGLADGVSGQPKFSDNSVISVKQIYDPITNSFSNVYYYWVKNKVLVPGVDKRKISSYEVASVIADPTALGLKFAAAIDKNSIMISNVGDMLSDKKLSLNIAQDLEYNERPTPKHTEWTLIEENSEQSMPPALYEKKLIDSLLGHDKDGNLVPDPTLSERTRYGIGIRPQQTLFKDRNAALRNIIEFSNSVLINIPVTGNYSFKNLNAQEEIPNKVFNEYDDIVEDNSVLQLVNTSTFEQAIINCTTNGAGEITEVEIANAGAGYGTLNPVYDLLGNVIGYQGPTFTEVDYDTLFDHGTTTFDGGLSSFKDGTLSPYGKDFHISTVVNSQGSIISASILHAGKGYESGFKIISRPHAVIVQSDDTYNGNWTKFEFDYNLMQWVRAHTQAFNTTLYWDYVDWISTDYNQYQIYSAVIGSPYELSEVDVQEGQYVKINNGGDGRYLILRKGTNSTQGSYGAGYDLVYSERGTVQISNGLWDNLSSKLGWDSGNTYDETLWDQTSDIELQYILNALKNDIFINEHKVNWNKLFFKSVRYALTEQKILDWAFKTSFITVTNSAGELTQPPVYKLQDSIQYENYINEVKPYKTKIRKFTTNYSVTENSNTEVYEQDRKSAFTLRFDRTSSAAETDTYMVTDLFVCNGADTEFVLSWIPKASKIKTKIKLDGQVVLSSEYSIAFFEAPYEGYTRQYAKIVFLNAAPEEGKVLTVNYKKGPKTLNAADRILSYYTTTNAMVGLDLGMLMYGVDYPGLQVGGQYEGIGFTNLYGGTYPTSLITGGTWTNGVLSSALGINPEDITISGEVGFLTTASGHAPEEVVPGFTIDSLGISVFTQGPAKGPVVISEDFEIPSSTSTQAFRMDIMPPSIDAMFVLINGQFLEYVENETLLSDQYTIQWENQLLVIPPQASPAKLMYSFITVGAAGGNQSFSPIDKQVAYTTTGTTTVDIESSFGNYIINDAYVTVDGVAITTSTTTYYNLDYNNETGTAIAKIYNLPAGSNAIQVWFFVETHRRYNEIRSQYFTYNGSTNTFTLLYPPGNIAPLSSRAIVEMVVNGTPSRLLPPDTNYYTVTNPASVTFPVNVTNTFSSYLSTSTIRVYKNNTATTFTYAAGSITVTQACSTGDSIIIESYLPDIIGQSTGTNFGYDYRIENNKLFVAPDVKYGDGHEVKITTFTTHDSMLMNTERFVGDPGRTFVVGRPILNSYYAWVTINRYSGDNELPTSYGLINGYDFTIEPDNVTVIIDDRWTLTSSDIVEIITINDPGVRGDVLGYRIFNDMLGGTTFTRLSLDATTYITQPLSSTSTQIYVNNASILTPPNVLDNKPGVVLVAGERIEFFQIDGNILKQITRGTLGTGPADYLEVGTRVVDQGENQIIGNMETVLVQNTFTHISNNLYPITSTNHIVTYPNSTSTIHNDGIVFSTATFMNLVDQVEVYYGGRQLRKSGMFKHDTSFVYDGFSPAAIAGTVPNINSLTSFDYVIPGTGYLIENGSAHANEVWMYTGLRSDSTATVGWVYSGLKYLEPEYTIVKTPNPTLVLNTSTLGTGTNIQVTIVLKNFVADDGFNTVISTGSTMPLWDSTTSIALFLKEGPTELPNIWYRGGDFILKDELNRILTNENGTILTGY